MSDIKTILKGRAFASEHFVAAETHKPQSFIVRGSSNQNDYLMNLLIAHNRELALFANHEGEMLATGATEAQAVLHTLEEKLAAARKQATVAKP